MLKICASVILLYWPIVNNRFQCDIIVCVAGPNIKHLLYIMLWHHCGWLFPWRWSRKYCRCVLENDDYIPLNLSNLWYFIFFVCLFVSSTDSFSLIGTVFGVLGSISLSLYSIFTKKTLPMINDKVLLLNYYVNVYACILFIPLMICNGELGKVIQYDHLFEVWFWCALIIGGICGFSIGFVTALQIKVTSPLTHNISGTAKACAQTIIATHWNHESRSTLWWFSNFVVLFGSSLYARVKQLEMDKKFNQQLLQYEKTWWQEKMSKWKFRVNFSIFINYNYVFTV